VAEVRRLLKVTCIGFEGLERGEQCSDPMHKPSLRVIEMIRIIDITKVMLTRVTNKHSSRTS